MTNIIYRLMGHSRDEKTKNHERIVEIASAQIRERGMATPGVAGIMNAAGLTHGGFYKHFDSRDDLVAAAVDYTFMDGERAIESITASADEPLAALVDWYASVEHCASPATGCGVVALAAEVAHSEERVRVAYGKQVHRYLARLERLLGGGPDAHRKATVALSSLVGAVLLARAVEDPALAAEILQDVRETVKALPAS